MSKTLCGALALLLLVGCEPEKTGLTEIQKQDLEAKLARNKKLKALKLPKQPPATGKVYEPQHGQKLVFTSIGSNTGESVWIVDKVQADRLTYHRGSWKEPFKVFKPDAVNGMLPRERFTVGGYDFDAQPYVDRSSKYWAAMKGDKPVFPGILRIEDSAGAVEWELKTIGQAAARPPTGPVGKLPQALRGSRIKDATARYSITNSTKYTLDVTCTSKDSGELHRTAIPPGKTSSMPCSGGLYDVLVTARGGNVSSFAGVQTFEAGYAYSSNMVIKTTRR